MTYNNWRENEPNQGPNGGGCVRKTPNSNGAWADIGCTDSQLLKKYSCNMDAVQSCDSSQALEYMLQRRSCIKHDAKNSSQNLGSRFPDIDIFLNPERGEEKRAIIEKHKNIAKNYFSDTVPRTVSHPMALNLALLQGGEQGGAHDALLRAGWELCQLFRHLHQGSH